MGSSVIARRDSGTVFVDSGPGFGPSRRKHLKPVFSAYARVITIASRSDLSMEEKNDIWWQHEDYEVFRKATGRLVQSMLNENINGWLGMKHETPKIRSTSPRPPPADPPDDSVVSLPKRHLCSQASDEPDRDVLEPEHQKAKRADQHYIEASCWWQRYRDLACFHEARKRQTHAKQSIRIVLNEQSRQRLNKSEENFRIQSSYIEATRWAINWATALAAARAEEVITEGDGGSYREETIVSFYAMKEALTMLGDRPEPPALPCPSQNTIASVCASQIRYRHIAIRRPMEREIGPQHHATMSPTTVANRSVGLDPRPAEIPYKPALCKQAAGFGTRGDGSPLQAGIVSAVEATERQAQSPTLKI